MRKITRETVERLREAERGTTARDAVSAADPHAAAGRTKASSLAAALVETVFLMAAVDGQVSALELGQFAEVVEGDLADALGGELNEIVDGMARALRDEGWERRLRAVTEQLRGTPDAERAYRLATSVAFVDDEVAHAEAAALDALAAALAIAPERAHAIMSEVHRDLFGD
jgi:tellurite resistance protein